MTNKIVVTSFVDEKALNTHDFFSAIFFGVKQQIQTAGREMVVYADVEKINQDPLTPFKKLLNEADGFIVLDTTPAIYKTIEPFLKDMVKPVVVLNYEMVSNDLDSVVFDSYENTRQLMQFLVELGHSRIGYVRAPVSVLEKHGSDSVFMRRTQAYHDYLLERQVPSHEHLVLSINQFSSSDQSHIRDILEGPHRPTALLASDDNMALRLYKFASFYKLRVPDDLTIVGYNGTTESAAAIPPLTTITTPMTEMGVYGVKRLLEKMEERTHGVDTRLKIVLPGKIRLGGSHRKI